MSSEAPGKRSARPYRRANSDLSRTDFGKMGQTAISIEVIAGRTGFIKASDMPKFHDVQEPIFEASKPSLFRVLQIRPSALPEHYHFLDYKFHVSNRQ